MDRRMLLSTVGSAVAALTAGCTTATEPLFSDPHHTVRLVNDRETDHEVFVEVILNDLPFEYGPETVESKTSWDVTTIESTRTVTVRYYVDGELVWDDTHEVPISREGRSSVEAMLQPDGDLWTWVEVDGG